MPVLALPLTPDPDFEFITSLRQWLTLTQAAQILGVSRGRVRQLCCTGMLSTTLIGRSRYVRVQELERFMRQRRPVGRPRGAATNGGQPRFRADVLGKPHKIPKSRKRRPRGLTMEQTAELETARRQAPLELDPIQSARRAALETSA